MDYTEAIVQLNNVLSDEFKERIINLTNHKAKNKLSTQSETNTNERNVFGYHLDFNSPTNLFYWNYIKKEIERLYYFYKIKFSCLETVTINQIDLLKYEIGGKYKMHLDCIGGYKVNRTLSVIINLNDDYEGGDLIFGDQKLKEIKRMKLKAGSVIFFPSNFLYPHGIEPITKGTRYSIVAWIN